MTPLRHFSSDNNAGVLPEVLRAIAEANSGHVPSYGADPYTAQAEAALQKEFGEGTSAFLVWNGTAANVLGLQAVTRPYQAVICAAGAHIDVDECGAPERFSGCKLLPVPTADGKLRPEDLPPLLLSRGDEHRSQPRVVSIAQATELGTVYRPTELRALTDAAHANDLLVHMDGARLSNAAASLGLSLREITSDAGVDLVSFGGTKAGLLGAEAVLFLNGLEFPEFKYLRKQGTHLASKMRFLAVQFEALLKDQLWRRSASHANTMARRLAEKLWGLERVRITQPVEANGVFAVIPPETVAPLQARRRFQLWNPVISEVRWMTAWDTTEEDVDSFAADIREIVG
ncbi:MAG TPA: low specificity L-threonine aldolase [Gemmatimonadales bacterium]|jgi:threonine aldolase